MESTSNTIPIQAELSGQSSSNGNASSGGSSRLKINKRRQDGNPLNKYIRNVPYEWNTEIKYYFLIHFWN